MDVITVMVKNQEITKIPIDNSKKYKAVLLNYDDHGFCKIIIDKHSFQYYQHNFHRIDKVLNQKLIVRALFEMIKDGTLNS